MFYIVVIVTVNHINIGIWLYRKRLFVQQRNVAYRFLISVFVFRSILTRLVKCASNVTRV